MSTKTKSDDSSYSNFWTGMFLTPLVLLTWVGVIWVVVKLLGSLI